MGHGGRLGMAGVSHANMSKLSVNISHNLVTVGLIIFSPSKARSRNCRTAPDRCENIRADLLVNLPYPVMG